MGLMGRFVLLVLLALPLATACKKQDAAAMAPENPADMPPPSPRGPGQMPETNAATVIADTGDVNAILQQLTAELRNYVVRTRSVPKNFEEFATKSNVQFPAAPAGKKYAISGHAVVLVTR